MPPEGASQSPRGDLLTYEEILRLARIFVGLGARKVRITGGEPLVRRDLATQLVAPLARVEGVEEVALTTNGHFLAIDAEALAAAGLSRINVSLDSLDPERFRRMTRGGDLSRVLAGLDAARRAGLGPIKINVVVVRGENDGEDLVDLVEWGAREGFIVRFIECMPIGPALNWSPDQFVPIAEVRSRLEMRYDVSPAEGGVGGGPAVHARISARGDGERTSMVGFIAALTENFCAACNRVRVTSEGRLRECLSREGTMSLRDAMRRGESDTWLAEAIQTALGGKVDGHRFASSDGHVVAQGAMSSIGG
jgi:cyclic pyranopterin phosphate synthase